MGEEVDTMHFRVQGEQIKKEEEEERKKKMIIKKKNIYRKNMSMYKVNSLVL
jgi:hypothetical protein